ncbi:hypothetical protein RQ734_21255 [Roseomonas mucosa]|uniref:hypothetical protein n=1 Tax=Roseomonas mucosa TaxID=207340 RepID=UPI0028CC70E0|nr:hypothetical protein [Roseomonas mucosa]MDT8278590.1 hypothetical protein [Roseomonas mucosa]
MHRRLLVILAVEAMSARAWAEMDAQSDSAPATLVLARQYVERHRATLPDLPALILGAGADGAGDRDTSHREIISAVKAEAAAAEPAFQEDMAMILAEGLTEAELRGALARGDLRGC